MIKKLLHWISHKTGTNTGRIASWQDDEYIYIGFECDFCKQIDQSTVNKIESEYINGKRNANPDFE